MVELLLEERKIQIRRLKDENGGWKEDKERN